MELNKHYIVLAMPDENKINIYHTNSLRIYQSIVGDDENFKRIGANIVLETK